MKRTLLLLGLFLCASAIGMAQVTSDFTLTANPVFDIPLGPSLDAATPYYSLGGGLSLKAEYTLPFAPVLYTGLVADADILPLYGSQKSITFLSAGPELGVQFFPVPRIAVRVAAYGGMYAGLIQQGSVYNPFFGGLADVSYLINPSLSLGLGVQYKAILEPPQVAYHGIGVNLGVQYHFGAGSKKADLRIEHHLMPIFPLFYSYYDKNPAGTLALKNTGTATLEDVTVSFFVKQFMDEPKVCAQLKEMKGGKTETVPVYALFKDSIFSITEGTKVAGEIEVAYRYLGAEMTTSYPVTVTINNRNALSWDDDRKAAAFVTAKDPQVMGFAKRVAVDAKSRAKPPAINPTFRMAVALFQAIGAHGVGYVQDPTTPYAAQSENKDAVDYLQFPIQTLAYRAGDCDDLSILYSSLLESVGIRAAFVTVPGHIYVAFNVEMRPDEARATFQDKDRLIIRGDETWIPVEVTLVRKGFNEAWRSAAVDWQMNNAKGAAEFVPVRDAWAVYQPVSSAEIVKDQVPLPDSPSVFLEYGSEMSRFIKTDLYPRVTRIRADLERDAGNVKLLNKLGVLYARFGMYREASQQFEAILARGGDVPASTLINTGNIYYLDDRYEEALKYYTRALAKSPTSAVALRGVAVTSYELRDIAAVDRALAELKKYDPATAQSLASLGSGATEASARAASADREVTSWNEE